MGPGSAHLAELHGDGARCARGRRPAGPRRRLCRGRQRRRQRRVRAHLRGRAVDPFPKGFSPTKWQKHAGHDCRRWFTSDHRTGGGQIAGDSTQQRLLLRAWADRSRPACAARFMEYHRLLASSRRLTSWKFLTDASFTRPWKLRQWHRRSARQGKRAWSAGPASSFVWTCSIHAVRCPMHFQTALKSPPPAALSAGAGGSASAGTALAAAGSSRWHERRRSLSFQWGCLLRRPRGRRSELLGSDAAGTRPAACNVHVQMLSDGQIPDAQVFCLAATINRHSCAQDGHWQVQSGASSVPLKPVPRAWWYRAAPPGPRRRRRRWRTRGRCWRRP